MPANEPFFADRAFRLLQEAFDAIRRRRQWRYSPERPGQLRSLGAINRNARTRKDIHRRPVRSSNMLAASIYLRLALPVTLALVIRVVTPVPVVNDEALGLARVSESVTRSLDDDPEGIDVRIAAFGESRNLRLVPDSGNVFAPSLETYIADVNSTGHVTLQKIVVSRAAHDDIRSKLYTDSAGSASLYVERRNGQLTLEGILDHETRIECRNRREGRSINDRVVHVVYKRAKSSGGTCLAVLPNATRSTSTDEHKVETRALPALIQPEVLLVLDYETSKYHNFNLDTAKKYLGVYVNSVNRRYATISAPKIQNVITAIVLTNSEAAQSFLVYGAKPIVDAGATLREFGKWITKQTSITSTYDIAIWMTALDLGALVNGQWNGQNLGVAYIGGACSTSSEMNYNVGLGEDKPGSFTGIHTHTHEIAHLYGSAHDGEIVDNPKGNPGALSCPSSDGYIMSYAFGSKNKFYFSSCSDNQMKFTMGTTSGSCLLSAPKASVVTLNTTLPGAIKSLDEQCAVRHGSGYKFYEPKLSEVCVRLWCAPAPSGTTITLTTQGPALEGSRCGTGMICINGECKTQ